MRRRIWPIALLALALAGGLWWFFGSERGEEPPPAEERAEEPAEDAPAEARPLVSGRVVSEEDGRGIAQARVLARCGDGDAPPVVARTDRAGRFGFPHLPRGTCRLRPEAEGYVSGGPLADEAVEIRVREDRALEGLVLSLHEAAEVSGRVVADEAGVSDVSLTLLYLETSGHTEAFVVDPEAVTGADGGFVLPGLAPGRVQVLAEHEDYALAESDELFLDPGERVRDLTISLAGGGGVVGRVVDEDGRAVPRALVRLIAAGASGARSRRSDRSGAFSFDGVGGGLASLIVRATGYSEVRLANIEVPAGERSEVEVVLRRNEGFGGVVLGPDGRPVANASVFVVTGARLPPHFHRAIRPKAYSDDTGRFWIEGWNDGWRFCYAKHARLGASDKVDVPGPGGEVELQLLGGGRLVGSVVDEQGEPVARFDVFVSRFVAEADGQPGLGGMPRKSVRDAAGRFAFDALAPGTYDLRVSASGYPAAQSRGHVVVIGGESDTGPIVLERGGAVTGRVIDAETGEPIARARVRSSDGGMFGRGAGRAFTDENGEFRLEGVRAERLSVTLRAGGYLTRIVSAVEVTPGGDMDLGTLRMQPQSAEDGHGGMQYSGIGAVLQLDGDRLFVRSIFEGSPSSEGGLGEGTEILRINGVDVSELGLRRSVEMIRGEVGTEVSLEVMRPDKGYVETVRIERAELQTNGRSR